MSISKHSTVVCSVQLLQFCLISFDTLHLICYSTMCYVRRQSEALVGKQDYVQTMVK